MLSGLDLAAQFFRLAPPPFALHQLSLRAARAFGFLTAGFGNFCLSLLPLFFAVFFETVQQPLHRELAVGELGPAIRGRHGLACGNMADRHLSADFIDVLAAGAAGARESFLKVFRTNAERVHPEEVFFIVGHDPKTHRTPDRFKQKDLIWVFARSKLNPFFRFRGCHF